MTSRKKPNSKKPFMRKRRVNILLIFDNKRFSFFKTAEKTNITMINVFVTFVFKAFNLRLIIKSR